MKTKIIIIIGIIITINTIIYHYGGYDFWIQQNYRSRETLITLYKLIIYLIPTVLLFNKNYKQNRTITRSNKWIMISLSLALVILIYKRRGTTYGGVSSFNHHATYLYVLLFNSMIEEYVFRGILQSKLESTYNHTKANIIQATIFTIIHIPLYLFLWGSGLLMIGSLVQLWLFAWGLGYCKNQTKSLFYPTLLHSILNGILLFL